MLASMAIVEATEYWASLAGSGWVIVSRDAAQLSVDERTTESLITQVARCRVGDSTVAIAFTHFPERTRDERLSLARAVERELGAGAVVFVEYAGPGHLRLDASECADDALRDAAFLGAAVVQASWSWDASERIRIESARDIVSVEAQQDELGWRAAIVERANP
jgi:hypothetical protein